MRLRTFVFLIVLSAAAVSVFGQITVKKLAFANDSESGEINQEFVQSVRSALNLSDAQVNALKTLLTMRQQAMEKTMESIEASQQKLEEVTSQTNPNPTEVGMAFLASRNVHEQMQAADQKFRMDFKALLSASQQTSLEKLKAASEQIHSLAELGILDGSAHHEFGMALHSDHMFAIDLQRKLSNEH
jgi:hypothetical protein